MHQFFFLDKKMYESDTQEKKKHIRHTNKLPCLPFTNMVLIVLNKFYI